MLSDPGEEASDDGDGRRDMVEEGIVSGESPDRGSVLIRFLEMVSLDAYELMLSSRHRLRSASGDFSVRS